MSNQYTTQEFVEAKLQRDLTDEESTVFDMLVGAVKQFIESWTHRKFELEGTDNSPVIKYFDGNGRREISINDAISISAVEIYDPYDSTVLDTIATEDYVLYPLNSTPKTSVKLLDQIFPNGSKNIKITGVWGTVSDVPDDIQAVATFLVAEMFSNPSQVKRESIEGYSRELYDLLPPIYQSLLDARVKVSI